VRKTLLATVLAGLTACGTPTPTSFSVNPPPTDPVAIAGIKKWNRELGKGALTAAPHWDIAYPADMPPDECNDPTITNRYLIAECKAKGKPAKPADDPEVLARLNASVDAAIARQAQEAAYQQKLAVCTTAGDIVALSIKSFWGGLLAGVATSAACMN